MNRTHDAYLLPKAAVLRWLTDPGPQVPAHIRNVLLGRLFGTPKAVLMAVINGLALNGAALLLHGGLPFVAFTVFDVGLALVRWKAFRQAGKAAAQHRPVATDLLLISAILWCAMHGAMAFTAMLSDIHPLQVLSATTIMALLGPICARNHPAPRLGLLLVCVCDLPFVAGAVLSGEPWLWVIALQTPLFLVASTAIIGQFHRLSLASLLAEHASHERARRDHLTGLHNRLALAEVLERQAEGGGPWILFCLDLDGFKAVNDTFGHPAGDRLLQDVAARLQGSTRGEDVVARLGGDEFVILARGMNAGQAAGFADSIIRRIAGESYPLDLATPARIGVSIGFACAPEDGTSLEDLLAKADIALYASKAAGKGVHRRFGRHAVLAAA